MPRTGWRHAVRWVRLVVVQFFFSNDRWQRPNRKHCVEARFDDCQTALEDVRSHQNRVQKSLKDVTTISSVSKGVSETEDVFIYACFVSPPPQYHARLDSGFLFLEVSIYIDRTTARSIGGRTPRLALTGSAVFFIVSQTQLNRSRLLFLGCPEHDLLLVHTKTLDVLPIHRISSHHVVYPGLTCCFSDDTTTSHLSENHE